MLTKSSMGMIKDLPYKLLEQLLPNFGYTLKGTFGKEEFILESYDDLGIDEDGVLYRYGLSEDLFPVNVTLNADPTFSYWFEEVSLGDDASRSLLISHGLSGNYGFFENGFTYKKLGDVGIDAEGNMYTYVGDDALPVSINAGTDPTGNGNFLIFNLVDYFPSFTGVEGLVGFEDKIINIFAGVDSLTDGAGGNSGRFGDSYINFVENSLRKKYGDAGVGWVAFDNRSTSREGMSFNRSANLSYIRTLPDKSIYPSIYSLDFGGLHSDSAVIGDYGLMGFAGDLSRDWDTCRIYYLQQPGGATIEVKQDGTSPVTVDTSGILSLQSISIQADKGASSQVRFDVTSAGACTVFGCYFTNDVTSGVIISRVAYGGFQTAWFAGLDSNFQTQWLSELNPTHYFFNGGRNDISEPYTAQEFRDNADTYMSRFPSTTEKLIFSPHESSTDINGVMDGYRSVMSKYAMDNRLGYIDNSKVLGSYENATSRGWMLDETHASATGNELIAANALKYMGANLEPWLQPKSFGAPGNDDSVVLEGKLEPRVSTNINPGASSIVMKINQLSGDAVVTALVTVRTGSGTGMVQSEHIFRVLAGSIVGSITSEEKYRDGMTETYTITLRAGSSSDFELVMNADAGNTNFIETCITASYSVGSPVLVNGVQIFSVD